MRHDDQRKQQTHAEDGDDDADAQEQALPELVPVLQHRGVDHRVVERQRDFHHAQDHRDTERRQHRLHATVRVTPPGGNAQADKCH
ncbi:hypothetical protein D3C72_1598780 [compost metagenome]